MKFIVSILILFFLNVSVFAQQRCKTDELMAEVYKSNPDYFTESINLFERNKHQKRFEEIITIPVHIIIVHGPGQPIGFGDNLSLERIQSQMDVINIDFRMLNPEVTTVPQQFTTGDSFIEFCLATEDPSGNPTDGVTRYETDLDFDQNEFQIKSDTRWDRDLYLNIWVTSTIGDVLGYALIPSLNSLPNNIRDGVVIKSTAFGGPGYAIEPFYNLGRTATHEIGHYLGLLHPWGLTDNGGCDQDDNISDTPLQEGSHFGCPTHPSPSCGNDGDMFMNFMEYVDDNCMAAFSAEQASYMYMILENSRSSLIGLSNFKCDSSNVDPLDMVLDFKLDLACAEDKNGYIQVLTTGGKAPLNYTINGQDNGFTPIFQALQAGNYEIIVTDDLGTKDTVYTEITAPPPILLNAIIGQNVSCFGGTNGGFIIAASGGTGSLLFDVEGIQSASSNTIFENLEAGSYPIFAIDDNGCEAYDTISLSQPSQLTGSVIQSINSSCDEAMHTGSGQVEASGGTGSYDYQLADVQNSTGAFENLAAGFYQVTITDQNACTTFVEFQISRDSEFEVSVDFIQETNCATNEGAMGISVVGENNEDFDFSIQGQNNNTGLFASLAPGLYMVSISDPTCQIVQQVEVPSFFNDLIVINNTDIICPGTEGGIIEVFVGDGSPGYIFSTNTETNITGSFENLLAGEYNIHISDGLACDTTIIAFIDEYDIPEIDINDLIVNCADELIDLNSIIPPGDFYVSSAVDGSVQEGSVGAGSYKLHESNCDELIDLFEIQAVNDLDLALISTNDIECPGDLTGSIFVTAVPAANDYDFHLNGETSPIGFFNNLPSGEHIIYAFNQFGCQDSIEVILEEPEPIIVNPIITHATVDLGGSIEVEASGGMPPYTYSINGIIFFTSNFFDMLDPGDYTVSVKDESDCVVEMMVTISFDSSVEEITDVFDLAINGTTVCVKNMQEKLTGISLLDVSGRVIQHSVVPNFKIENIYPGVYILIIETEEQVHVSKVFLSKN